MAITIYDIAQRAGVTGATVSNVLRERGGASKATASRIQRLALELGYRPHSAARATANGRFGSVAMILSAIDAERSGLPPGLLRGTARALDDHGMHLTMAVLPDEALTDQAFLPRILCEWTCDGLLINYNKRIPQRMIDLLEEYHLPSIWLNCKRDCDCVYPDDLAAGREAAQRLLAAGHRRVAYVSYSYKVEDAHYSELDRRDGYLQAMREAGLPCQAHDRYADGLDKQGGPAGLEHRTDVWRRVLARAERPTGVVAYGASTLRHVLRAAEDVGLRVPRDLSVVTFGGAPLSLVRQIATVVIPEAEVGRVGVEMLLAKIAAPGEALAPRVVATEFRPGETIGPPQAGGSMSTT